VIWIGGKERQGGGNEGKDGGGRERGYSMDWKTGGMDAESVQNEKGKAEEDSYA